MESMRTDQFGRVVTKRRNPQQSDDVIARMTETYTKLYPQLMRRLTEKFGYEPEDAEDILQNSWIKLTRQPEPEDRDWTPFVLQAVKSTSMNKARDEGNRDCLEEKNWDKVMQGFGLQDFPEVKITKKSLAEPAEGGF